MLNLAYIGSSSISLFTSSTLLLKAATEAQNTHFGSEVIYGGRCRKGIASVKEALQDAERSFASLPMDVQSRRKNQYELVQLAGIAVLSCVTAVLAEEERKEEERKHRRRERKRIFRKKLKDKQVDRFKKAVARKQWALEQSVRAEDTLLDRKINKLKGMVEQEVDADVEDTLETEPEESYPAAKKRSISCLPDDQPVAKRLRSHHNQLQGATRECRE